MGERNYEKIKSVVVYEGFRQNPHEYKIGISCKEIKRHHPAGDGDYHSITIIFTNGEMSEYLNNQILQINMRMSANECLESEGK